MPNKRKRTGRAGYKASYQKYENEERREKNKARRIIKNLNSSGKPEETMKKILSSLKPDVRKYVEKYSL